MKKITLTTILILTLFQIYAQNEVDAFRFSEMFYGGTARSMAMGNAFGALGADLSTASTNPAGLGVFKHANFAIAPSFDLSSTNSTFSGSNNYSDDLSFFLNNLGIAFGFNNNNSEIKRVNIAIGYNRYNNFNNNYNIGGINDKGSMLDAFMFDANGFTNENLDLFSTDLAWDTWLINDYGQEYDNVLWKASNPPKYGQDVSKIIQTSGGAGETFFSSALNYNDILYFGGTLGLQYFNYTSNSTYTESNFVDNDSLKSFSYQETVVDDGTGVNFKFGVLVRPADFIRIGAAIHSPTFFNITDEYETSMTSFWNYPYGENQEFSYQKDSPHNTFKYRISTPMRLLGNLGFVIKNVALIGIDYEYVDYSSMRMSANDYMFTNENKAIKETFRSVHNLKAGAEVRLGLFSLRGGYAYWGNPYKNNVQYDFSQISGGVGFSRNNFFLDIAYIHNLNKTQHFLYNGYQDEPVPQISRTNGIINTTLGFRF